MSKISSSLEPLGQESPTRETTASWVDIRFCHADRSESIGDLPARTEKTLFSVH